MLLNYPYRSSLLAALMVLMTGLVARAQPETIPESTHGFLGVLPGPVRDGGAGVVVLDVTRDSAADHAGLKRGDRITKMSGQAIAGVEPFLQAIAARKPGDELKLEVVRRDGKEQSLTLTLGERPGPERFRFPEFAGMQRPAYLGVQTQPLTPEIKKQLNVETNAGVVVTEVLPNSPAARAGLQPSDVITAVNNQPANDPAQLRDLIQKAGAGKEITLQVVRGKEKLSIKAALRSDRFGFFMAPGQDVFPTREVESMVDQSRHIRELERRIEDLEKRLRALEKK
jgi:S1-C subfamily serine protease